MRPITYFVRMVVFGNGRPIKVLGYSVPADGATERLGSAVLHALLGESGELRLPDHDLAEGLVDRIEDILG